nr:MAG TPA: hypothetical protein [Caudoviricetes sp.]
MSALREKLCSMIVCLAGRGSLSQQKKIRRCFKFSRW